MTYKNTLAREAYAAYSVAVGGKAYDGQPLKSFDEFSETIVAGWEAVAESVAKTVSGHFGHDYFEALKSLESVEKAA